MASFSTYTAQQWLLFFYFYCFVGWCFESVYVSICERRLINRGFLRGPCLPIYGCGAIIMLFASLPVKENMPLIFLCGGAAATLLEYFTGVFMEWLFKVKYWDYSKKKFNFHGYICLSSSIAWGGFSILLIKVTHIPIESVILRLNDSVSDILVNALTVIFAIDLTLSVKAAIDIKNVLSQLSKIKEESEKLLNRVETMIQENAFLSSLATKYEERVQSAAELHEPLHNLLHRLHRYVDSLPHSTLGLPSVQNSIDELKDFLSVIKERRRAAKANLSVFSRWLLSGNPSISSKHFPQALSELHNAGKSADSDSD